MKADAPRPLVACLAALILLSGCQTPGHSSACPDCREQYPDHDRNCPRYRRPDSDELKAQLLLLGGLVILSTAASAVSGKQPSPPEPAPWPHSADLQLSGSADARELSSTTRARILDFGEDPE